MPEKGRVHYKKYYLLISTLLLLVVNIFLFNLEIKNNRRGLTFAMLDVGQGDALFIESPTGTQILVDGGPPGKILSQLARVMSPFDRTIDSIIITNPDEDHIGGLSDILKTYEVGMVFEPGTINDSKTYQNLKNEIKDKKILNVLTRKGMKLDLGGGASIDILFPDGDVTFWDTNTGSVVAELTYGGTSVMLMGDSTEETERIIMAGNQGSVLKSKILKVGHHGSRTSTSEDFVKVVSPMYAFISNGKDNKYGHPHRDTLSTLESFGVKIFRTDLLGAIIMKSDGQKEEFSFIK